MRITGGEFRGRRLQVPKGLATRPTPSRVREALFQILGDSVPDARVAELFGGTGSLGLESLSRGAAHAVFCETSRPALACLAANVDTIGVGDRVTIFERSAFELPRLVRNAPPFDLAFSDPPHRYLEDSSIRRRLETLLSEVPLARDGIILLEHRAGRLGDFHPPGMELVETRAWGTSGMAFLKRLD